MKQKKRSIVKDLNLIPWPYKVECDNEYLSIDLQTRITATDTSLAPLAKVLAGELKMLTNIEPAVTLETKPRAGDITLSIDSAIDIEQYHLKVAERANISGGDYGGVAAGTVTLLQALEIGEKAAALPAVDIVDNPCALYRGLMVDPARSFHSPEMLRRVINLCRWYKIRFLQLHLTDDQSFTFPSSAYPKLPTPERHYTLRQLRELEKYASERGVVLVPEFDMPGHGKATVEAWPELFATETGSRSTMNYARPEVGEVIDDIIGEMLEVFRSSPYFHIGADEVNFENLDEDPDFRLALDRTGLGDAGELYRKFIVERDKTVKQHDRQTIVWEGFRRSGRVRIPRDILVMAFESSYYRPEHLIEDGYTVINASWQPLYLVAKRPAPVGQWPVEHIYNWNMYRWEHFREKRPAYEPIDVPKEAPVIGAQMCSWENPQDIIIPYLRKRLAAMSERLWNERLDCDFTFFSKRLHSTDKRLDTFLK